MVGRAGRLPTPLVGPGAHDGIPLILDGVSPEPNILNWRANPSVDGLRAALQVHRRTGQYILVGFRDPMGVGRFDSQAGPDSLTNLAYTAAQSGGLLAQMSQGETLNVTNSLFFDNGAILSSGANDMSINNAALVLTNNTFGRPGTANRASASLFGTSVNAQNNIWSGHAFSLRGAQSSGSENFNILHNAPLGPGFTAGANTLTSDPQFTNLGGDFSLGPGSPAIDAGNNAALSASLTQDRAGNPRRVDVIAVADTGAGTASIIDRGAFERPNNIATATPTPTPTFTPTRTPTASPTATRTATSTPSGGQPGGECTCR